MQKAKLLVVARYSEKSGPQTKQHIEYVGVGSREMLSIARRGGRRLTLLPNPLHDLLLIGAGCNYEEKTRGFIARTGTFAVYEEPGKPFGRAVSYRSKASGLTYVFEVPARFRGMKNTVLAANDGFACNGEAPIVLVNVESRIVQAKVQSAALGVVEEFPENDACEREADPQFGIPHGKASSHTKSSRTLYREKGGFVGFVVRTDVEGMVSGYRVECVAMDFDPEKPGGALAFEGSAEQIARIIGKVAGKIGQLKRRMGDLAAEMEAARKGPVPWK